MVLRTRLSQKRGLRLKSLVSYHSDGRMMWPLRTWVQIMTRTSAGSRSRGDAWTLRWALDNVSINYEMGSHNLHGSPGSNDRPDVECTIVESEIAASSACGLGDWCGDSHILFPIRQHVGLSWKLLGCGEKGGESG